MHLSSFADTAFQRVSVRLTLWCVSVVYILHSFGAVAEQYQCQTLYKNAYQCGEKPPSDVCWLCRDRMAPSSGRPSQDSAQSWSFDHHPHSTWHHNSESIVSLLPSATEILFVLGLGSR